MKTILTIIKSIVEQRPDDTAILYLSSIETKATKSWSYRELWNIVSIMAANMCECVRRNGTPHNSKNVILTIEEGPMLPLVELAVLYAGYTIIPADVKDPRLLHLIKDSEPIMVIIDNEDDDDKYKQVYDIANRYSYVITKLKNLMQHRRVNEGLMLHSAETSHIFFTSGSTGRPKGCIIHRDSLLSYCEAKNKTHQIDNKSIVFVASPHTFDPSLGDYMATLCAGGTIAIAPRSLIFSALGACLMLTKATHVLTTPSLFNLLGHNAPCRLKHLRTVALGGETMPQRIVDIWSDKVTLINTYGVTECCVYQAYAIIKHNTPPNLIGNPLPGNELHVMPLNGFDDPASIQPISAKIGDQGELWISGKQIGLGYLNLPELTFEKFISHKQFGQCFRTGDIVQMTHEGWRFVGRNDTQIKILGKRVELEEIENVLLTESTSLLLSSVIVTMNQSKLIAWCIPSKTLYINFTDHNLLLSDLLRYICEENLPGYMVPSRFILIDQFPMTATGKISRKELSERPIPESISNETELLTDCEVLVNNIWIEVLGLRLKRLPRSSHFFALGGDSLAALRVCQSIAKKINQSDDRDEFGESLGSLSPTELLKRPILSEFAQYLSMIDQSESIHSENINQSESKESLELFLYKAVSLGAEEIVRFLIKKKGINPDGKCLNRKGNVLTPLHIACANKQAKIVVLLLELNASPSVKDPNGVMPIHLAAQKGPSEILDVLLRSKVPITSRDGNEQTILHHAARANSPSQVLDWIMEKWSRDENVRNYSSRNKIGIFDWLDKWKRTPLHWAVVNGNRNVVAKLLEAHADKKIKDKYGETPLEIAERRARCSAAELRPIGMRASVFGDIAKLLGGSGSTRKVLTYNSE
jgi:acyl-coenzyme A synthetase/AMP-(fatty) acid ligase